MNGNYPEVMCIPVKSVKEKRRKICLQMVFSLFDYFTFVFFILHNSMQFLLHLHFFVMIMTRVSVYVLTNVQHNVMALDAFQKYTTTFLCAVTIR